MDFGFLTKGKRGKIYLKNGIALKKSKPRHIANEVKWIKILNKKGIGPKLVCSSKDSFSYKFVKGEFFPEWLEKQKSKKKILQMIKKILMQCRKMDLLEMNKLEMHNPYKHIIITKKENPVMIDFERAYHTKKPKNTTQFCQYLMSGKITKLLKSIKINKKELIPILKKYKKDYSEKNFKKILSFLKI